MLKKKTKKEKYYMERMRKRMMGQRERAAVGIMSVIFYVFAIILLFNSHLLEIVTNNMAISF